MMTDPNCWMLFNLTTLSTNSSQPTSWNRLLKYPKNARPDTRPKRKVTDMMTRVHICEHVHMYTCVHLDVRMCVFHNEIRNGFGCMMIA